MQKTKSLWNMIQGDPAFMRTLNGWLAVFWIVMVPIAFITGWLESVTFVSALSLWALVSGHWSAWQAARTEVEQQKVENQDTEGRIVKRILKETTLHAARTKKIASKKG